MLVTDLHNHAMEPLITFLIFAMQFKNAVLIPHSTGH